MPGSLRKMPVWLPIVILLVAMASSQGGASLAKSLFPLVGAPGVTALRLALGTLILTKQVGKRIQQTDDNHHDQHDVLPQRITV